MRVEGSDTQSLHHNMGGPAPQSRHHIPETNAAEQYIDINDVIDFAINQWRFIAVFVVLGAIDAGITNLISNPPRYE